MNPVELLDHALMKEREDEESRAGKYRLSLFGRCYRMQYWSRLGVQKSNPVKPQTLRVFKMGDLVHNLIQAQYPKNACEVGFEDEDFSGHADIVTEDRVIDIKSIRSFGFKLMKKENYSITKDKENYILQVMGYAHFLEKPYGQLVFFDKDNLESSLDIGKPFLFDMFNWAPAVLEEMELLKEFWRQKKLPAALPRCYNGKECQYCIYQKACETQEGGKNEL